MPDKFLESQIWVLQSYHNVLKHRCYRRLGFTQFKLDKDCQQFGSLEFCLMLVSYEELEGIFYVVDLRILNK
jgi:hypothetical protein